MFELVLHNATEHRQLAWLGTPLRVTNRAAEDGTDGTLWLPGDAQQRVDFTISYESSACCVRLENRGLSLVLPSGKRLAAGVARDLPSPLSFWVGSTHVTLAGAALSAAHDNALVPFPALGDEVSHASGARKLLSGAPASHTLAHWFEALRQLQQSPAGTPEFFAAAAFALFDPGGLDAGLVLLRHEDSWHVAGSHMAVPGMPLIYRRDLLARVVAERHTLFHDARLLDAQAPSGDQPFVVAAPLMQPDGDVSGVLYGVRYDHPQNRRRGVRPLEAQFVQALADTVAARQAALAQETQVAKLRVRLEQAFSPTVARELERNPRLLEGVEREITVLFADLRGSTALAETLAPRALYQLLGDVLERLTQVVSSYEGTVIDYYGDGLAAFWNAPLLRAGHPLLACQAAHAMQRELHDLSHDWQPLLGRRLRVGIGIHTGLALVGNAGSQKRIKYGPRGNTVHLAARIEGATRHVGVPILLSSATARAVAAVLPTRRVFRDQLDGIAEPVDLFEPLFPSEGVPAMIDLLSQALELYERGDDRAALATLTALCQAHPGDAAAAHLLRRTQSRLASRPD